MVEDDGHSSLPEPEDLMFPADGAEDWDHQIQGAGIDEDQSDDDGFGDPNEVDSQLLDIMAFERIAGTSHY